MSKAAAPAGASKSPAGNISFEEALGKLESIVKAMESDDLALEQLLVSYEEGNRLAQLCQSRLADAELKIQQLEKDASGQVILKPMSVSDNSEKL